MSVINYENKNGIMTFEDCTSRSYRFKDVLRKIAKAVVNVVKNISHTISDECISICLEGAETEFIRKYFTIFIPVHTLHGSVISVRGREAKHLLLSLFNNLCRYGFVRYFYGNLIITM